LRTKFPRKLGKKAQSKDNLLSLKQFMGQKNSERNRPKKNTGKKESKKNYK